MPLEVLVLVGSLALDEAEQRLHGRRELGVDEIFFECHFSSLLVLGRILEQHAQIVDIVGHPCVTNGGRQIVFFFFGGAAATLNGL